MMSAHAFAVLGLALNGIGGLLLVVCPPPTLPRDMTPEGVEKHPRTYVLKHLGDATKFDKAKYYLRLYGFKTGFMFLLAGFLLQLVGELMKP